MKNKNKFDAMLDVIEAGDTEALEQLVVNAVFVTLVVIRWFA